LVYRVLGRFKKLYSAGKGSTKKRKRKVVGNRNVDTGEEKSTEKREGKSAQVTNTRYFGLFQPERTTRRKADVCARGEWKARVTIRYMRGGL